MEYPRRKHYEEIIRAKYPRVSEIALKGFLDAMKNRNYGDEETLDAFKWFLEGYLGEKP